MKKRFLSIALILCMLLSFMPLIPVTAAEGDVAIIAENFPDENFRNYVKGFDTNNDNSLTPAEISNVKTINVADKNITDLTGVGLFTNVTELSCSDNELTSLDLSKNTALTTLNCSFNELTSLDLSKNTALTTLNCSFNELTSLDLSQNTALTTLRCSSNKLTSLDLSLNTALTSLNCGSNELTSLNLSKNTVLETLVCSDTKLTSLDLSLNTALTSLNCGSNELTSLDLSLNTALETLYCDNNELTSLDLSKNTALKTLSCINNELTSLNLSQHTALETLYCSNNQLTSLDLSKNTALTTLHCFGNQLTSLDLSKNTALEKLYCYNNELTSLDLSKNTALETLYCYNNPLTSLDLSKNKALKALTCYGNGYKIDLVGGTFDLSKLPTGFDIGKATNWKNATVNDNILTVSAPKKVVTYTYDLGNNKTTTFRLLSDSRTTITANMIAPIADQRYTNADIEPEITITCGSYTLISGTDYTVSYENNKNVGTATVTVTGKGDFYKGSVRVNFKIIKASQSAPSEITNTAETIDGKADGKITGVTTAMEYRKESDTTYTAISGTEITNLSGGKYYVRYKADGNHNASDDTEITVAIGRKLTVTVPTTQVGYTLTVNKTELVWNDSVELTFALADGYSIAVNVNGNPITLDANGKYTVTDVQSDITVTVTGVADITAPTGEIKLGTNSWKAFLNNITFGLFFKDTEEVTITATDNSGEAVKIEYLLSDKELTAEELATATFTAYTDKFNVEPNNEYVIYAKLSDNSGNVTYINSNGIVLDNIAPVISGIVNGNTYCEAQTVTVSDKYEVTVTVNGTPVTLDANGQFTLSPASGTQTVVATDKAGNVSAEMIVTVNDGHETDTPATCIKKAVCKHCGVEYGEVDNSNHDLENIKGSAATVTETGNTEYWHCKDCDNNFSDKGGKNVIDLKDTVISKLAPEIIDGKGQSLTEGEKKELTFRSNAAYSDFIRVELDGKTVDKKNYIVKEGSTIVTLKADYVATLSVGEHTLGIVSQSGTATTTFTVNAKVVDTNSPQTGDNSHMALWFALLFVSGGALVGTAAYGKKRKRSAK